MPDYHEILTTNTLVVKEATYTEPSAVGGGGEVCNHSNLMKYLRKYIMTLT